MYTDIKTRILLKHLHSLREPGSNSKDLYRSRQTILIYIDTCYIY